jgi:peptide/nickel transport system substrate-binding protein
MVERRSVATWMIVGFAAMLLVACGGEPVPRVVGVSISQGDVELDVGESVALSATVEVVGGAGTGVVWSSEDEGVASVGPTSGVVTGVSPGAVAVRAISVVDSSKSDSVAVTVVEELVDATNRVVIAASQEPGVLGDLVRVSENRAITTEIDGWLFAGLYRVGLDGMPEPDLVTEVASTANGRMVMAADGDGQRVELSLTLRDDVLWSDGTPITTTDLEFVAEVAAATGARFWERLAYETIDGRNFKLLVSDAQASDLVGSPMPVLPAHVLRSAWDAALAAGSPLGDVFMGFGSATAVNDGRWVSSGPFVAVEWQTGAALSMVRNRHYHAHPVDEGAYAQVVEYRFISDANTLLSAIVSGEVHATSAVSITFDQALSLPADSGYRSWFVPSTTWEHLEVNQFTNVPEVADLLLDDVRTRRAILHAIDRQGMVDSLFGGMQWVAHSNVAPFDPIHDPDVRQYDFDPLLAGSLLAELGWTLGSDGVLERVASGGRTVRFELEFVTTSGNSVRERQQQFIADGLRAVGIGVRIANAPSNVVFASEFMGRGYDGAWTGLLMFAWVSTRAATLNASGYLCRTAPTPSNGYVGTNVAGSCVEEYDELRDRAVSELDSVVAKPLYQEMQRTFAEELMAIPLLFRSSPIVTADGLVNFVTSTFSREHGYPPSRPELVGWFDRGAVKVMDQADHALQP